MSKKITMGALRSIKLPPAMQTQTGENGEADAAKEDAFNAIRKTLRAMASAKNGVRVLVPDSVADLVPSSPSSTPAPADEQTDGKQAE